MSEILLGKHLDMEFDDNGELQKKETTDIEVSYPFLEETTDFRMNIEGRSGSGKTNTLARIIEQIGDYNIPTLVIDKMGVLTTAAIEVEGMVTVGAKEEKGIDIAIPLQEVDIIADMMLDQGMKVMLDLRTYKHIGDTEEKTMHRAVAKLLNALMDRSHELMRSGNRKRTLVISDEVHHFAPERGSQHVDTSDKDVKKCRAAMMNLATEGGNKGVSSIYAYQRRALTMKTVVSQSDNYIVHALESSDADTASKAVDIPEHYINNLDVGEAIIKGKITEHNIHSIKVDRRNSPDPREESFTVPEPPEELEEALQSIQEQVEEQQSKRQKQKSKIDKLENKIERLEDRNEELEQRKNIAEVIREGIKEDGDTSQELTQEFKELENRNDQLQKEVEEWKERASDIQQEKEQLQDRIEGLEAELEEKQELEVAKDEVVSNARSILRMFGELDVDEQDQRQKIKDLQEKLNELKEENKQLRQREPSKGLDERVETYKDWLDKEPVNDVIQEAKSEGSPRYIKGVLANIIRKNGKVDYQEIADNLGIDATTNISAAATLLEKYGVVEKIEEGGETFVDLNTGEEGLEEIIRRKQRRKDTEEIMDEL